MNTANSCSRAISTPSSRQFQYFDNIVATFLCVPRGPVAITGGSCKSMHAVQHVVHVIVILFS